jgi:acyl-CoA synthetase (NDP forming)
MKENTNPLSTHDLIYHCMDDSSRDSISAQIDHIMKRAANEHRIRFMETIQEGIKELITSTKFNPWEDYYCYESGEYEFIDRLKKDIWNCILRSNPKNLTKYNIQELLGSMKANYPEEYHAMIHKEYVDRAEAAEKKLKELSLKVIRHDVF